MVNEQNQTLETGESREVVVRGDHIMTGYWKDKERRIRQVLKCEEVISCRRSVSS